MGFLFSKLQSVLTIHARLVSSKGWHYSFPIDAVEFQWGKNVFIILTLNIREYEALGVYDDKGEDEHKEANRWWGKKTENAVMSWSELTFYLNGNSWRSKPDLRCQKDLYVWKFDLILQILFWIVMVTIESDHGNSYVKERNEKMWATWGIITSSILKVYDDH